MILVHDYDVNPISWGDFLGFVVSSFYRIKDVGLEDGISVYLCGSLRNHSVKSTLERYGSNDRLFKAQILRISKLVSLISEKAEIHVLESLDSALDLIRGEDHVWPPVEILKKRGYIFYFHLNYIALLNERGSCLYEVRPPENIIRRVSNIDIFKPSTRESGSDFKIISVNIRNYVGYARNRNALEVDWLEFVRVSLSAGLRVAFIGQESQALYSKVENLPNVDWSGNYDSDPLVDLSFIYLADFHMGSSSGFSFYSSFLRSGYSFSFNTDAHLYLENYGRIIKSKDGFLWMNFGPGNSYLTEKGHLKDLVSIGNALIRATSSEGFYSRRSAFFEY